jgi:hypothetical protein
VLYSLIGLAAFVLILKIAMEGPMEVDTKQTTNEVLELKAEAV